MTCPLGVGCDEYGVCYADAHGSPTMCPHWTPEDPCDQMVSIEQVAQWVGMERFRVPRYDAALSGYDLAGIILGWSHSEAKRAIFEAMYGGRKCQSSNARNAIS